MYINNRTDTDQMELCYLIYDNSAAKIFLYNMYQQLQSFVAVANINKSRSLVTKLVVDLGHTLLLVNYFI